MTINKIVLLWERKVETQYTTQTRSLLALPLKLEVYHTLNCDLNKEYVPEATGAELAQLG